MNDLVEALIILSKYGNPTNPTHFESHAMVITEIDPDEVDERDIRLLKNRDFFIGDHYGEKRFMSFRFASA